jgi:SAM-dependent methyltransferase
VNESERRAREESLRTYYDDEVSRRAVRELDPERVLRRDEFVSRLASQVRRAVLEVGCGAGRDGVAFARAGLDFVGVDLAAGSVEHCRGLGLHAEQASVLCLPFPDDSFDAGWTMSTLLHVADQDLPSALAEIARVLRSGSALGVGVWGGVDRQEEHHDGEGGPSRFFAFRSDEGLRGALQEIGSIDSFETWVRPDDHSGLHYQFVHVRIAGARRTS